MTITCSTRFSKHRLLHMITVLIGFVSSELLCFGTASAAMTDQCKAENTITDGTTAFKDLTKKYELYATSALTLSFANFKTVSKIFSDRSTANAVTVNDVETATKDNLILEKTELTMNDKTSGQTYTFKSLKFDTMSLLKPKDSLSIKIEKLDYCTDLQFVAKQLLPISEIIYTAENLVLVNHGGTETNVDGATYTKGMVSSVLVNAMKGATLIYPKPAGAKILEDNVPITIQSIVENQKITFDSNSPFDFENSHWKVTATVPTTLSINSFEDARKMCILEAQHFFTLENGARLKLDKYFDSYCIGDTAAVDSCKDKSLKATEYSLPFYQSNKQNVTLDAYGAVAIPVTLDDLKGLDVLIKSGVETKAKIDLSVKPIESFKDHTLTINNVDLTFKALAVSVIDFGKVKFFNSTVKSDEDTGNKPFVSIIGDEITSDISNLGGLKPLIKKQMSGGAIEEKDVSKVSVSSDGKKMTVSKNSEEGEIEDDLFKGSLTLKVSGGSKESEDKRIPFEIETTTTTLKKMAEGSKTFDFSLEMPSGLSLYPIFVGDWSGYTIEVRGGDDFVYDSVTKAGSSGPKIENNSGKPIIVDGQEIASNKNMRSPTSGSLSAGGIAGIVIACVVVVAAFVFTVIIVIRRKAKVSK